MYSPETYSLETYRPEASEEADGHLWAWAWNGRVAAAAALDELQAAEGARAGDELLGISLDVATAGLQRVVFMSPRVSGWTIETGDGLYNAGGPPLVLYAAYDLAVKLMERGRYDLLCDVRELGWCWGVSM